MSNFPDRIDIHVHATDQELRRVTQLLERILTQGRELLMASAELKAVLARVDTATDNIAADIRRLKDKIGTGMTDDEVAEVQGLAEAVASKLEGIAADPDNPDPSA
jgi:ribosome-associated translation inhibitor RaiA